MVKNAKGCLTIVLLFFLASALIPALVSADQGSAQNALSSAESTLKSCYDAVTQAESAGADVTALVITLNGAAEVLSKAKLAYASNNFDASFEYASQSKNQLSDFLSQANAARESALNNNNRKQFTLILSLGLSVAILFVGVATYFSLSRSERRTHYVSKTPPV